MKHIARFPHVLALALLTAGLASAQERPERGRRPAPAEKAPAVQAPASLDAARAAFRSADANSDGLLDAVEAGQAGIDARRLSEVDADGTAGLSGDEFVVAFRHKAEREQRGVTPELEAEAARVLGLRTRPVAQPQPQPGPTRMPPASAPAAPTHEEKLKAILESLNKRVRNSELSQAEALATYASVSKRLDNALLGAAGVQGTLSKADYLTQVKEHLNTRVRKAELADADALALYERVAQRIDNALAQPPSDAAPAAQPDAAPPAPPTPAEGQPPAPQDGAQRARQPADGSAPGGARRAREPVPEGAPPREGGNARPRRPAKAPEDKPGGGGR